ncbi:MAG: hypothetical protein Q8O67_19060 [Deltaproteobacteria bacterium]|nr:hypothetical protein [Deltaproteobacteria bacterium]
MNAKLAQVLAAITTRSGGPSAADLDALEAELSTLPAEERGAFDEVIRAGRELLSLEARVHDEVGALPLSVDDDDDGDVAGLDELENLERRLRGQERELEDMRRGASPPGFGSVEVAGSVMEMMRSDEDVVRPSAAGLASELRAMIESGEHAGIDAATILKMVKSRLR